MTSKTAGIALTIVGLLMIIYTGFNYITTEKVVDIGPVKITKEKNHYVQWPPVVGAVLLVGGIAIIVFSKRART